MKLRYSGPPGALVLQFYQRRPVMTLDKKIIAELREMKMAGSQVHEMIAFVKQKTESPPDSSILIIRYFKDAFCLSLYDVLPIQGCSALGQNAYSDDEINEVLGSKIEKTRDSWKE